MATSRPVRIPRASPRPPPPLPSSGPARVKPPPTQTARLPSEWRPNRGGTQRAVRVTLLYLLVLGALYVGFVLYDRTAPGGTSSAAANGVLLFTALFAVFALAGSLYTLTPAPRGFEVARDGVTVVGRWGRRRSLPPLEELSFRVVRHYLPSLLADTTVDLIELWGRGVPVRGYLVDEELITGAIPSERGR